MAWFARNSRCSNSAVKLLFSPDKIQNLFCPSMPDEAIRNADHPIPANNVGGILRGGIAGEASRDASVLAQDIIDPHFDNQPVLQKIPADECVPKEGRVVVVEHTRLLPPAIIAIRIEFKTLDREIAQLELFVLGPEMRRCARIDGADRIAVIGVGRQPDAIEISNIFAEGKATAAVVDIIVTQQIANVIDAPADVGVQIGPQINPCRHDLMIEPEINAAIFRSAHIDRLANLPAETVGIDLGADRITGIAKIQAHIEVEGFDLIEIQPKML